MLDDDLSLRLTIGLALVLALPAWVASRWLANTPYTALSLGCLVLIAGWVLHLVAVVVHGLRTRLSAR